MNYSVGDNILCNVEICPDGSKRILIREPYELSTIEIMTFPIVSIDEEMQTYKIIIPDDVTGWMISKFHTKYQDVDEKYLGKKFYDITEGLILDKAKKKK